MFRTNSNPAIRRMQKMNSECDITNTAGYVGIAAKSIYFVLLTVLCAVLSFLGMLSFARQGNFNLIIGLLIASTVVALITGFVAVLFPSATKISGSIYAAAEGLMIGFLALVLFSTGYAGVVFAALLATMVVFGIMMTLYATGVIRVGSKFRKFMISALIGAVVVNLLMFVISLFSASLSNLFYGNGALSIIISVIMVLLASFMILLDLDRMTMIVQNKLDKRFEWIAAFGLLVTLIWLYMEFLKLFLKLASRRR